MLKGRTIFVLRWGSTDNQKHWLQTIEVVTCTTPSYISKLSIKEEFREQGGFLQGNTFFDN